MFAILNQRKREVFESLQDQDLVPSAQTPRPSVFISKCIGCRADFSSLHLTALMVENAQDLNLSFSRCISDVQVISSTNVAIAAHCSNACILADKSNVQITIASSDPPDWVVYSFASTVSIFYNDERYDVPSIPVPDQEYKVDARQKTFVHPDTGKIATSLCNNYGDVC
ncbi:hypothetical protein HDU91_006985 [Kappamyces sp. JEL0680]|nr:hypothetical protein HDU91_006985 [Kappamyces sp. JEL0680]